MQSVANAQAQAAGQISTLASTVTQRLDAVSKSLTDGVAQSAVFREGPDRHREDLKNTQA